jgi:hypothetical protein
MVIFSILFSVQAASAADRIKYGRDINGNRVMLKVGDEDVKYGRDMNGNRVIQQIGGENVRYGRDINGNRIPVEIAPY